MKESLLQHILADYSGSASYKTQHLVYLLTEALLNHNLESFFTILKSLFASIPSHIFIKDKEAYYHTIIYLILTLIGVRIEAEVHTHKGRIDAVIKTEQHIYIMEFKLGTAKKALEQIEEKQYYEKYLRSNQQIILILLTIHFPNWHKNFRWIKLDMVQVIRFIT